MDFVSLRPGAIEYVHWEVTGLPTNPPVGSVQVSLDDGVIWHPATVAATSVPTIMTIRFLVAHPSVLNPDPSAVVSRYGSSEILVRFVDDPEIVVRCAGRLITVGEPPVLN